LPFPDFHQRSWKNADGDIKHIGRKSTNDGEPTFRVPTVKFDPSRVTDAVQADIWENILLLEEINSDSADRRCFALNIRG
jgi:hypothetical protein